MSRHRHGLRELLFHGHSDSDPYDHHNWAVPPSPLGGNRPFPIPPTPSESSATSSDEKAHGGAAGRMRKYSRKVRSRSRSRHRPHHHHGHRHHHEQGQGGERITIEDGPMDEEERRERMGIVRGRGGGREETGAGGEDAERRSPEEGGGRHDTTEGRVSEDGRVRIPQQDTVPVQRSKSKKERKDKKEKKERKERRASLAARPTALPPLMSAPIIMTTPATPTGDPYPHAIKSVKKRRSTTLPVAAAATPSTSASSFFQPTRNTSVRSGGGHQHSRDISPPSPPPPRLYAAATLPRYRVPLEMPDYPATPPPLLARQDSDDGYIASSPADIRRLPTLLRAGAGPHNHDHHHDEHPAPAPSPSPRDSAVEIGDSRELRRTDSHRSIPRRPEHSLRDSILSTFSHPSRSNSLPSSSSIKSTSTTALTPLSPAARRPPLPLPSPTQPENPLSILRTFDTLFLIDDSPSMLHGTRWTDTAAALSTIAEIATRYDQDGIDILFLNDASRDRRNVTSAAAVAEIFREVSPVEGGSTPLGGRLDGILRGYLDRYAVAREEAARTGTGGGRVGEGVVCKPLNIVVVTDGDATDDPESVIVAAARELDRLNAPLEQVGVQMFQVGGDEEAAEFLRGLDDDLSGIYGIRDMVDTTPYTGEGEGGFSGEEILKVLVGAVNRRVDRRRNRRVTVG